MKKLLMTTFAAITVATTASAIDFQARAHELATNNIHRVQLNVFNEKPVEVEIFIRGIRHEETEKFLKIPSEPDLKNIYVPGGNARKQMLGYVKLPNKTGLFVYELCAVTQPKWYRPNVGVRMMKCDELKVRNYATPTQTDEN